MTPVPASGENPAPTIHRPGGSSRRSRAAVPVLAAALVLMLVASSCTRGIGWGVVLWTIKAPSSETAAVAGSLVPVYVKSNIGKVYIIGLPDGNGQKMEVPFWQVRLFPSRGKATSWAREFADAAPLYLLASRDGLPVREKPDNAAKRVYRLRDGQSVKVLEKVRGEPVTTGGKTLAGDWYRVLTDDGTTGFAFSNTMRLYDERSGTTPQAGGARELSPGIDLVFSRTWRPLYFQTMIDENGIDPGLFSLSYGLFTDAVNRQVRVELPGLSQVFNYGSITEESGWYLFGDTPLRVRVEGDAALLASWSGTAPSPAAGAGEGAGAGSDAGAEADWTAGGSTARFVVLSADIREAIRRNDDRQAALLGDFLKKAAGGPNPESARFDTGGGGILAIMSTGQFAWDGADSLPAGFPPTGGGGDAPSDRRAGTVIIGLPLADSLTQDWDGGFALVPEGGKRADFVYRIEQAGLRLARAIVPDPGERVSAWDRRTGIRLFPPMNP